MNKRSTNLEWRSLTLLCLPTLSILLSTNIVVATLSDINHAFKGIEGLGSWTLLLYSTTAASLSIAAGELGDRVGLRRVYGQGLTIYLIGSCIAALAINGPMLLAGRVVSGSGAAILAPVALAFLSRMYQGRDKPIAFGYWATSVTIGTVAGPILGGLIEAMSSWRWTFIVAAAPALLGLIMIRKLPRFEKTEDTKNQPIDLIGIGGLSTLPAIGLITLNLSTRIQTNILAILTIILLAIGTLTWRHLNSTEHPAIPLARLKENSWWRPTVLQLIIRIVFMAMLVILTSYFHNIRGESEINASRDLLPFCIAVGIMSFSSGYICQSLGVRKLLQSVFVLATAGAATLLSTTTSGFRAIDWAAIITIGILAGSTSQLSRLALSNFAPEEAMRGASLNTLVINLGLALGAAYPNMIHGVVSNELHLGGLMSQIEMLFTMRLEITILLFLFIVGTWQARKIKEA